MSTRDVDAFLRFHELWTAGDISAALEYVDADVVAQPLHGIFFSRSEYRGHDGIQDWYHEMTGPWDGYEVTVEDVYETDEGVVGILRLAGHRGEETFHGRVGSVCTLR